MTDPLAGDPTIGADGSVTVGAADSKETPMTEPRHTRDDNGDGAPDYSTPPVDAIPPGVRSALYVLAALANAAVLLYFGLAAIWGWLPGEQAARTEALALGVLGLLVSSLGVAYRPTRKL